MFYVSKLVAHLVQGVIEETDVVSGHVSHQELDLISELLFLLFQLLPLFLVGGNGITAFEQLSKFFLPNGNRYRRAEILLKLLQDSGLKILPPNVVFAASTAVYLSRTGVRVTLLPLAVFPPGVGPSQISSSAFIAFDAVTKK